MYLLRSQSFMSVNAHPVLLAEYSVNWTWFYCFLNSYFCRVSVNTVVLRMDVVFVVHILATMQL